MTLLEKFCKTLNIDELSKIEQAIMFMWFHQKKTEEFEFDNSIINSYFEKLHLPKYNITNLKNDLNKSKKVIKGSKKGTYKLSRNTLSDIEDIAGNIFKENEPINVSEVANLSLTPFLNEKEIESARKMAELYLVIHCFENSVRKLIEDVLSNTLGTNWFNLAASSSIQNKYNERSLKEKKHKWLAPRGISPLFYIDWGDLVTLIRKYPNEFSHKIPDLKFVELRLEELEKIRNIVAHNGTLQLDEDFQRVILYFKDWCKQLN